MKFKNYYNGDVGQANSAKICILLFVISAFVSYLYVITSGYYNGDLNGIPVTQSFFDLTISLILSLIPYLTAWKIYKFFKNRPVGRIRKLSSRAVCLLFYIITIWFIVLAINYGVGVMGQPLYDAPFPLKPFIQASNRINPFYLGVFFIITYNGSKKILWLGVILLITLGFLRSGLGVLLYIFLAFIVRESGYYIKLIRNNKVKFTLALMVFPFIAGILYSTRDSMRGYEAVESSLYPVEVVITRLAGRLSSFSNSAYIFQEGEYFESEVRHLPPNYFLEQVFGGVFGVGFIPDVTPERLFYGVESTDVSYMLGLPGNLYFSWLISPYIFILNILLTLLMCIVVFLVARGLRFGKCNEFALLLLLYPLTSGVASEFSALIASLVSFWLIFSLISIRLAPEGPIANSSNPSRPRLSNGD